MQSDSTSLPQPRVCVDCGGRTSHNQSPRCLACYLLKRSTPKSRARKAHRICAAEDCDTVLNGIQNKFCSPRCRNRTAVFSGRARSVGTWSAQDLAYLRERYPHDGCEPVAAALGREALQVRSKANVLKIILTKDSAHRIVHSQARKYMTEHNPMRDPLVRQKVSEWARNTPEGKAQYEKLMAGQQRIQRREPSGLERRMRHMLTSLEIPFEPSALIKPNFVVDVRIGNLIIQADGEYWHGHPRYEPLTERQTKQQQRDRAQEAYLTACGYTVVRIWEGSLTLEGLRRILADHHAAASAAPR